MANPVRRFPGRRFIEHEGFYGHSHYFGGFALQAPRARLYGGPKFFANPDG